MLVTLAVYPAVLAVTWAGADRTGTTAAATMAELALPAAVVVPPGKLVAVQVSATVPEAREVKLTEVPVVLPWMVPLVMPQA